MRGLPRAAVCSPHQRGANLGAWSRLRRACPDSSVVEHFHGKEGVVSSILTRGPGGDHPTRRGSSAGQSARLIIVRSRVRAPPPLPLRDIASPRGSIRAISRAVAPLADTPKTTTYWGMTGMSFPVYSGGPALGRTDSEGGHHERRHRWRLRSPRRPYGPAAVR